MISVELARRLRTAGLTWEPRTGDRFVIPDRDMDDEVFVISSLVVDVQRFPSGQVLAFNGTVEWALDSVERDNALWLPDETQLRDLLGGTFRSLLRIADRYRVGLDIAGRRVEFDADAPDIAYAYALLHLATGVDPAAPATTAP